ncbi:hypothetical protein [Pseudorhizobium flavum]|uniref:hypothetical protein n=1 Tax=Pseudorhizobium flavum TaxID=1335061 RepID=UPI002491D394|nr:hypothetical protein [Pseudorhizobium flavum]
MLLTQFPRSLLPRFLGCHDGGEVAVDRKVGRLAIGRGLDDDLADDPPHEIDPDLASTVAGVGQSRLLQCSDRRLQHAGVDDWRGTA